MRLRAFRLGRLLRAAQAVALLLLCACSGGSGGERQSASADPLLLDLVQLYTQARSITVDAAYEQGAEPYSSQDEYARPCWRILRDNLQALAGPEVDVYAPESLLSMTRLPVQARDTWTTQEIVELARGLWSLQEDPEDQEIHVLFLNGFFEDADGINDRMLGVSYAGTNLVAIFKDVVRSSSGSTAVRLFVEQATLVHETGHLLGLVNNGIPAAGSHEDAEHPSHCMNGSCVMYWLNEGAYDLADFIARVETTRSLVLYCDECLADVSNYRQGLSADTASSVDGLMPFWQVASGEGLSAAPGPFGLPAAYEKASGQEGGSGASADPPGRPSRRRSGSDRPLVEKSAVRPDHSRNDGHAAVRHGGRHPMGHGDKGRPGRFTDRRRSSMTRDHRHHPGGPGVFFGRSRYGWRGWGVGIYTDIWSPWTPEEIRDMVRADYARMALRGLPCCDGVCWSCPPCEGAGPPADKTGAAPYGPGYGLGCGDPNALASLAPGEVVVDLGSGSGLDCFIAARKVGEGGRVIGVDMTPEMVECARKNARAGGYGNVEFRLGDIEHLPLADSSADVVISNCVINLCHDKAKVFREAFRVLKPGGRIAVSDMVLLEEPPEEVVRSRDAWVACMAGAMSRDAYIEVMEKAGFEDVEVEREVSFIATMPGEDGEDVPVQAASVTILARKPS
jgi:SAM-dependent methyltransferase/predicted Zn-dependent protease